MSKSFILYFLSRLGFYLKEFFSVYFKGAFNFFNSLYWNLLDFLDRKLDVSLNLRYFTVPFWQEYSFLSYFLSIPVRFLKIVFGGLLLLLFSILFWCLYLGWVSFLIVLIYLSIKYLLFK